MSTGQTSCKRCGTCCLRGGPVLHTGDAHLVESGRLRFADLVTIRKGELAVVPPDDDLLPAAHEMVKINGRNGSWACRFYEEESSGCSIYGHRPLSCEALKCWDTAESLALVGKDLLCRKEMIGSHPAWALLAEHQQACPPPDPQMVLAIVQSGDRKALGTLAEAVNLDLRYRAAALSRYSIGGEDELFFLGRPLFQLLSPLGIAAVEQNNGVVLRFREQS